MTEVRSRWAARVAWFAALTAVASTPAWAAGQDTRGWRLTIGVMNVDANLGLPEVELPAGVGLASDERDTGFALAARYRFTRRLEAELGYLDGGESSVDLTAQVLQQSLRLENRLGFEALVAGLDVHLTPGRRVDVYAGPLLAFLHFGDIRPSLALRLDASALPLPLSVILGLLPDLPIGLPIDPDVLLEGPLDLSLRLPGVDVDDEVALGGALGVDVALDRGGHWFFNAALRYLDSSVEGPLGLEVDLNPVLLGMGVTHRF